MRKRSLQTTVQSKHEPLEEVKPSNRWTNEEQIRFVDAVRKYGRDWDKIAEAVGTRTPFKV